MANGILDTCCLINFYASGHARAILDALKRPMFLPESVKREALYLASSDKAGERDRIDVEKVAAELHLLVVAPETDEELDLYVGLATELDDGEAMALALAKARGLTLLTDERKAGKKATSLSVEVLTTPDVLHVWSESTSAALVTQAIQCIEARARYAPFVAHPRYGWWQQCRAAR